jgi:hypothetical protein
VRSREGYMQEERAGSRETIPSSLVLSYFIFLLLFKQIYIYIYIYTTKLFIKLFTPRKDHLATSFEVINCIYFRWKYQKVINMLTLIVS